MVQSRLQIHRRVEQHLRPKRNDLPLWIVEFHCCVAIKIDAPFIDNSLHFNLISPSESITTTVTTPQS
jgi:hypothetical protein